MPKTVYVYSQCVYINRVLSSQYLSRGVDDLARAVSAVGGREQGQEDLQQL